MLCVINASVNSGLPGCLHGFTNKVTDSRQLPEVKHKNYFLSTQKRCELIDGMLIPLMVPFFGGCVGHRFSLLVPGVRASAEVQSAGSAQSLKTRKMVTKPSESESVL